MIEHEYKGDKKKNLKRQKDVLIWSGSLPEQTIHFLETLQISPLCSCQQPPSLSIRPSPSSLPPSAINPGVLQGV